MATCVSFFLMFVLLFLIVQLVDITGLIDLHITSFWSSLGFVGGVLGWIIFACGLIDSVLDALHAKWLSRLPRWLFDRMNFGIQIISTVLFAIWLDDHTQGVELDDMSAILVVFLMYFVLDLIEYVGERLGRTFDDV